MIASGNKTIELRLFDEKRQLISIGDTLIFTNTKKTISTISNVVENLQKKANFEELYQALPLDKCGYLPEEITTASAKDMEVYYSLEKQKRYGVVGIEIRLK
jgi:ASC-1-like (ASCH) protein